MNNIFCDMSGSKGLFIPANSNADDDADDDDDDDWRRTCHVSWIKANKTR